MTVPQFRRWLEEQIDFLRGLHIYGNPDDNLYAKELIEEAYQHAVSLRLPEAAAACKPGPETIRLMECLNAIPEPDRDLYTLDEAAERLGVSRRTVSRMIERGELECTRIGRRVTITAKQLADYQESADSETLFG